MSNSPKEMYTAAYAIVRNCQNDSFHSFYQACENWIIRNNSTRAIFGQYVLAAMHSFDNVHTHNTYPLSKFRLKLRHGIRTQVETIPF